MNFLGMGPLELMLIVILALIVFGPAKLPEIMGQVGKAIGDFRRATSELSDEFNKTIQTELGEARSVVEETRATFKDAHAEVNAAVTGMPAPERVAAPVPNGTSEPHVETNGAAPAMADTTQWSWETSPSTPSAPPETPVAELKPNPELGPTAPTADEPRAAEPRAPEPRPGATGKDEILPPY